MSTPSILFVLFVRTLLVQAQKTSHDALVLDAGAQGVCTGGTKHGERVDLAEYWYLCNNGQLEPVGCFAPNRHRLTLGEVYTSDGLQTKCQRQRTGAPLLVYVGCTLEGSSDIHRAGEFWNDMRTHLWYYCEQLGTGLRLNFGGCVTPDGERVGKETENVRRGVIYKYHTLIEEQGDRVFTENVSKGKICSLMQVGVCARCTTPNVNATTDMERVGGLMPVGCVYWGKRYALEQTFQDKTAWYTCETNEDNTAAVRRAKGCIYNNQQIQPELLDERTVVQISSNGSTAARTPVGCMTERGIRPIGQRWIIGGDNEQYRYQLQCTLNADGTSVTQTAVACAYYATGAKTPTLIEPGCFRIVGSEALACKRQTTSVGGLALTVFDAVHASYAEHDFGVRACDAHDTPASTTSTQDVIN